MDREKIKQSDRIVIKFGTNILTNDEGEDRFPAFILLLKMYQL